MKITDVKVIVTSPGRNYVAVKIMTDQDGLYGVGDASLVGAELAVVTALEKHLVPLLIGKDPANIQHLWQMLHKGHFWRSGSVMMTALSGIDMALWDIKGKVAGLPIYSLLGGRSRNNLRIYGKAAGRDKHEVADATLALMEDGYSAIRVQVGIKGPGLPGHTYGVYRYPMTTGYGQFRYEVELPRDESGQALPIEEVWEPRPYLRAVPELFAHLRETCGPDVDLLHQVHGRLTPNESARLGREVEPFDPYYLQLPIRPEQGPDAYRMIREHTVTPWAIGEMHTSRWEMEPLISKRYIDYVRCDISHVGGISELVKIASMAETYEIRTSWHGPTDISPIAHAAQAHVDLAVPNFGLLEWVPLPAETLEVFPGHPVLQDGHVTVGDAPGLGCDIDEEKAARYPFKRTYMPQVRRLDGSVHWF